MANEFNDFIPRLFPPADLSHRPRWSVMIPTYNCATYLRETLASVLAQDPGPEQMQIEVVDDGSTQDDPEAVVLEMGRGRVLFFRQPQNVGVTKNFNTCLARSRGWLVHLLHGDDLVDPGFYEEIDRCADRFSEAAIYFTRSRYIDESGQVFGEGDFLKSFAVGSRNPQPFYFGNPIRTPSVVIRRAFYERHGGFCESFSHVADWEMWTRAVRLGGGVMSPALLARYREFSGNDTSRLRRTAGNLCDCLRLGEWFSNNDPDFDLELFQQWVRSLAWAQYRRFQRSGDASAVEANYRLYQELSRLVGPKTRMKAWIRSIPTIQHVAAAAKGRWLRAYGRRNRKAA